MTTIHNSWDTNNNKPCPTTTLHLTLIQPQQVAATTTMTTTHYKLQPRQPWHNQSINHTARSTLIHTAQHSWTQQHGSTTWTTQLNNMTNMAWLHNTAQQHGLTTWLDNTARQHGSTTWLDNTAWQHGSTTRLHNTAQQHSLAWLNMAWHSLIQLDRHNSTLLDIARFSPAQRDTARLQGSTWHGTVQHGSTTWLNMVRHSATWLHQHSSNIQYTPVLTIQSDCT